MPTPLADTGIEVEGLEFHRAEGVERLPLYRAAAGISGDIFARALYRQPKILLLGEATSHLDAVNEQLVNLVAKALSIMKANVAHRSETIDSAGRVRMLQGGKGQELRSQTQAVQD